jgi:hypothetical protein
VDGFGFEREGNLDSFDFTENNFGISAIHWSL